MENSSTSHQLPSGGASPPPPQDATANLISTLVAAHAVASPGDQETLLATLASPQMAQAAISAALLAPTQDGSSFSSGLVIPPPEHLHLRRLLQPLPRRSVPSAFPMSRHMSPSSST
ncbi:hypothetical protein E2562_039085 [Oryza meyeriana var. granulata]|uniref:Uncharacterized protein n=1 Tax=Oryza meyeriana var. granulata TaxID=110450 RepID=A0A6G1C4G0_9ORYZ|nr:hypothetical protein E2562_039085 [Oryza meyeriana var. granulata]